MTGKPLPIYFLKTVYQPLVAEAEAGNVDEIVVILLAILILLT